MTRMLACVLLVFSGFGLVFLSSRAQRLGFPVSAGDSWGCLHPPGVQRRAHHVGSDNQNVLFPSIPAMMASRWTCDFGQAEGMSFWNIYSRHQRETLGRM